MARYRLILAPELSSTRKMIDRVFIKGDVKIDPIEGGSCQAARDFAQNGVGLAIVHSLCIGYRPATELSYINVTPQFGTADFSIIYRKHSADSILVRALLEQLTTRDE